MEEALVAIVGSSVLAALVTSIFGLVSARGTERRVTELEGAKQEDARNTFRYTKLYEALSELRALPSVDYRTHDVNASGEVVESRDRFGQVVEATTTRHGLVQGIYGRVQPLILLSLRTESDELIEREEKMSTQLAGYALGGEALEPGVDVVALIDLRRSIEEAVLRAVTEQIERLTATSESGARS